MAKDGGSKSCLPPIKRTSEIRDIQRIAAKQEKVCEFTGTESARVKLYLHRPLTDRWGSSSENLMREGGCTALSYISA